MIKHANQNVNICHYSDGSLCDLHTWTYSALEFCQIYKCCPLWKFKISIGKNGAKIVGKWRPIDDTWGRDHSSWHLNTKTGAEFIVPDSGDKVNSRIGLSYRPARLHRLAGQYDNHMLELTISPSQGQWIWPHLNVVSFLSGCPKFPTFQGSLKFFYLFSEFTWVRKFFKSGNPEF